MSLEPILADPFRGDTGRPEDYLLPVRTWSPTASLPEQPVSWWQWVPTASAGERGGWRLVSVMQG